MLRPSGNAAKEVINGITTYALIVKLLLVAGIEGCLVRSCCFILNKDDKCHAIQAGASKVPEQLIQPRVPYQNLYEEFHTYKALLHQCIPVDRELINLN